MATFHRPVVTPSQREEGKTISHKQFKSAYMPLCFEPKISSANPSPYIIHFTLTVYHKLPRKLCFLGLWWIPGRSADFECLTLFYARHQPVKYLGGLKMHLMNVGLNKEFRPVGSYTSPAHCQGSRWHNCANYDHTNTEALNTPRSILLLSPPLSSLPVFPSLLSGNLKPRYLFTSGRWPPL